MSTLSRKARALSERQAVDIWTPDQGPRAPLLLWGFLTKAIREIGYMGGSKYVHVWRTGVDPGRLPLTTGPTVYLGT